MSNVQSSGSFEHELSWDVTPEEETRRQALASKQIEQLFVIFMPDPSPARQNGWHLAHRLSTLTYQFLIERDFLSAER